MFSLSLDKAFYALGVEGRGRRRLVSLQVDYERNVKEHSLTVACCCHGERGEAYIIG